MIGPMSDPETPAHTLPASRRGRATTTTAAAKAAKATPKQPNATVATTTPAATTPAKRPTTRKPAKRKPAKRKPADPAKAWVRSLARSRPGLLQFVTEALAGMYGRPVWQRVHDPTSEMVLTILSQNSADVNAEQAFESLRRAYPGPATDEAATPDMPRAAWPGAQGVRIAGQADPATAPADPATAHEPGTAPRINRPGWGGVGLEDTITPDWDAVEQAPIQELTDVIRSGGLANQKAPRIQAALKTIREQTGSHSLEFLGEMSALDARDWLTAIDGIGRKTASVVLLFSFGTPLMPVDRHVERVSQRIGLIPSKATADDAHELYLAMLEPDQMYEGHVNLIQHGRRTCHARKPACDACPVAPRCRFIDRRAP